MMQPGMHGAGIDQVRHGHLVYTPQALVIGMGDDLEYQLVVDCDEPVNRVVDDLAETHVVRCMGGFTALLKVLQSKPINALLKLKN
jgi:hypothetical protein